MITIKFRSIPFVKKFSLLTTFIFVSLSLSTAPAQQVLTFTDKDSLRVGDIFELTYVVEGNYSSLSYPTIDDFEEDLEVLSRRRYQVSSNRDSLVYRIQFFATENVTISAKSISLNLSDGDTTLSTARVPLFFNPTLAEGDEEFRPLKPIFDFARSAWPVIVFLLLLAVAGYFFYRWYQKREAEPEPTPVEPPEPFINPLVQLRKTLESLPETGTLHEKKEFEQYYIKLGNAIRLYIKRVHQFPAMEMTTREITENLQKELASTEIIKITRSVLNEADMVKFANFKPDSGQAQNVLRKANDFAEAAAKSDSQKIEYIKFKYQEEIEKMSMNGNKTQTDKVDS